MTQEKQLAKQKELDTFKETLRNKTLEELEALEQEAIAENDKINEEIANTEFDLPTKGYKEAAKAIQMFLARQSVAWQYALGELTLYKFWDPAKKHKKINYPTLDSTLRQLGDASVQFTGPEEWEAVIAINEYAKALHEDYIAATEKIYDAAAKHNLIMQEMELKKPIPKK